MVQEENIQCCPICSGNIDVIFDIPVKVKKQESISCENHHYMHIRVGGMDVLCHLEPEEEVIPNPQLQLKHEISPRLRGSQNSGVSKKRVKV